MSIPTPRFATARPALWDGWGTIAKALLCLAAVVATLSAMALLLRVPNNPVVELATPSAWIALIAGVVAIGGLALIRVRPGFAKMWIFLVGETALVLAILSTDAWGLRAFWVFCMVCSW